MRTIMRVYLLLARPPCTRSLRRMIRERGMEAHFPVEVRFVAQDDLWLSPAYGRDVCYIGIIVYKPFGEEAEHAAYFRAFDEIMLSLQVRRRRAQ